MKLREKLTVSPLWSNIPNPKQNKKIEPQRVLRQSLLQTDNQWFWKFKAQNIGLFGKKNTNLNWVHCAFAQKMNKRARTRSFNSFGGFFLLVSVAHCLTIVTWFLCFVNLSGSWIGYLQNIDYRWKLNMTWVHANVVQAKTHQLQNYKWEKTGKIQNRKK